MKASLVITLATTAIAARQSYEILTAADLTALEQQLAKWKALYGPIAKANGFLPPVTTETFLINGHTVEELQRFHDTVQDVQEAALANPDAQFSPFNQFALLTNDEFKNVLMKSFNPQNFTNAAPLPELANERASEADWSTSKCNPPIANQGSCGSCWAFATIGTVETAHCIATGELLDLSEQQLVSCDKKNSGCNGGNPSPAIDWMQQGVCTEESYPYTSGKSSQSGTCQTSCTKKQLTIGKTKKTSGESSLMTVLESQPATVAVESGNAVWRNYKSGIVSQCPGGQSDHAVIAVGYGTSTGDYFKIKNSWGTQWGDNGYMYLKRGMSGKGMCNVAEWVWYPELSGSPPTPSSSQPPTPSSTRKPFPSTSEPPKPSTDTPMTTTPSTTRRPFPTSFGPKPSTDTPMTTTPSTTRRPFPTSFGPKPSTDTPATSMSTPTTTKRRYTRRPRTSRQPKTTGPSTTDTPSPTTEPSSTFAPKPTTQPSSTSAPTPSTPSGNGVKDQLIAQTNKIRAAHGVAPLAWDDALASKMQTWASSCPGFKHGGPSGWQNLATNTACGSSGKDCMKVVGASWLWYDQEETFWNYGSNSCNGDWAKCGHFSNMMSPEVKSMACGWSQCANGNYVWCNYNTPVKNPKVGKITGMTKAELKASLTA
ncbi:hypothetical protein DYB31_006438 [Aphanomyces astaci]|uniref:Peptidase C1A papain C-terminal domain-containing protein n=1 Tax=Aphanomyces astaci TaxID=112090 RepID=A0A397EWF9_APHAT|nr:hypothetical protein DYB31_006438 [Aphanomyces astaci]